MRWFAIVCSDTDAPDGVLYDWATFDLPEGTAGPSEDCARGDSCGWRKALSDFGKKGHGGPCPPRGHGDHHYHFRLIAIDTERLPLRERPNCRDVRQSARHHLVAEAEVVGIYAR